MDGSDKRVLMFRAAAVNFMATEKFRDQAIRDHEQSKAELINAIAEIKPADDVEFEAVVKDRLIRLDFEGRLRIEKLNLVIRD